MAFLSGRRKENQDTVSIGEPTVTIHLPIYNEKYVTSRLINSVCDLDYPKQKMRIMVLDDSDDDTTGKLDMNQQKSKWFKALDKKGAIIQYWEVQNEHLVGWIINQMTQLGLKTNNEVAEAIAYCTEGNLLASMQEIQKLQHRPYRQKVQPE